MGRRQKRPLRGLTDNERAELNRVAASPDDRVERIRRARVILAVAEGKSFTQAARTARMRSSSGVAAIVQRFHDRGLEALDTLPGAGRRPIYSAAEREMIMAEVQSQIERMPFWSLSALQQALRQSSSAVPRVSAKTIGQLLREAGYAWDAASHGWVREGVQVAG